MAAFAVTQRPGAAATTRARTESKLWAWLGIAAFVVGLFVTWSVQFAVGMSDLDAGGQPLLDAIDTNSNEALYRITSGLGYLVVAALIVFGVGLRRLLTERDPESSVPAVIFGSILVTAAGLALAMSFRAQVFDGITSYQDSPATHIMMNRLQQDTVLAAWAAMLAATLATAVAGFRGSLVPRGIAWFSAVMSAFIIVLCMAGAAFPANIPALLWLGVIAVWAVRTTGRDIA